MTFTMAIKIVFCAISMHHKMTLPTILQVVSHTMYIAFVNDFLGNKTPFMSFAWKRVPAILMLDPNVFSHLGDSGLPGMLVLMPDEKVAYGDAEGNLDDRIKASFMSSSDVSNYLHVDVAAFSFTRFCRGIRQRLNFIDPNH